MACAQATTEKDSALNSEVAKTLNALVHALKSNSTRLHNCSMAMDPDLSCDVRVAVQFKIPQTEDQIHATTLEPQISGPSSKRHRSTTISESPGAMKKRARSSPFTSSDSDEDLVG